MAALLLPAVYALGVALQLTADGADSRPRDLSDRDSVRALQSAQRAQDDFERLRRWSATRTFDRAPAPCVDQVIGRLCHWYGDTAETTPPEEPERIAHGRRDLLSKLTQVASVIEGDDWVAGQRTRYLVEAGDTAAAVALASHCRATPWWCDALLGFARHAAGDYAGADAAFASALARMPEEQRCEWEDVSQLLDDAVRGAYEKKSCAERTDDNARIWWLADPFHAVPGNDRRTEHFARLTMSRIQEDAWNAHALPWGDDLEEVTVRYGWATWWTRGQAPMHALSHVPITGHGRTPAYHFLPDEEILEEPRRLAEREWSIAGLLRGGKSAREYYAPAYARTIDALESDAQLFSRGDSSVVVVTYDASTAHKLAGHRLDAAVALSGDPRDTLVVRWQRGSDVSGVLAIPSPWRTMLVSTELIARAEARAARARRWAEMPGASTLSSGLLLLRADAGTPATLEEALPHVRTNARIGEGDRVGLYWETYGGAAGDTLLISIAVNRERPGAVRRAFRSLGLGRSWTPIRISWSEAAIEPRAISGRSLLLDLAELDPGRYDIELRVTRLGGETITARRSIEIVPSFR